MQQIRVINLYNKFHYYLSKFDFDTTYLGHNWKDISQGDVMLMTMSDFAVCGFVKNTKNLISWDEKKIIH